MAESCLVGPLAGLMELSALCHAPIFLLFPQDSCFMNNTQIFKGWSNHFGPQTQLHRYFSWIPLTLQFFPMSSPKSE